MKGKETKGKPSSDEIRKLREQCEAAGNELRMLEKRVAALQEALAEMQRRCKQS